MLLNQANFNIDYSRIYTPGDSRYYRLTNRLLSAIFFKDMKLIASLLGIKRKTEELFDKADGKTLAEYKRELLVKIGRRQFEKLNELGLSIQIKLA